MTTQHITSLEDPRLAPYRQLKQTNDTRRQGLLITEGDKLTERLLASGCRVHSLLVGQRWQSRYADLPDDVPVFVVPDDAIYDVVGFNFHRGVLGCGYRPAPQTVAQLCEHTAAARDSSSIEQTTLVICPDVQDPENLGTIFRLASALGASGMVLGKKTADPWSRRVLRVSMGASLRLPIAQADDMLPAIHELQSAGFCCLATVLDDNAVPLTQLTNDYIAQPSPPGRGQGEGLESPRKRPQRLAIFFGSEGHGLDADIVAACDVKATIPMAPGVDSLNVATAAAIFLYELRG